jgi:hypothetical protein
VVERIFCGKQSTESRQKTEEKTRTKEEKKGEEVRKKAGQSRKSRSMQIDARVARRDCEKRARGKRNKNMQESGEHTTNPRRSRKYLFFEFLCSKDSV